MTRSIALDLPGCGLRAFFYWGAYLEIKHRQEWTIDRIYGRSSGALVGACILCDLTDTQIVDLYHHVQATSRTHYIEDSFCLALEAILPPNAYALCSGKLFITAALLGCIPITTSLFRDNRHLIHTIRISGSFPFFTTSRLYFDEATHLPVLDGCLIDWIRRKSIHTHGHCRGPRHCLIHVPVLQLNAPVQCWPGFLPLSAHHPITIPDLAIDMGRRFISVGSLQWSHSYPSICTIDT
jgi:hypothetical protein